jgi:hypothetical protein
VNTGIVTHNGNCITNFTILYIIGGEVGNVTTNALSGYTIPVPADSDDSDPIRDDCRLPGAGIGVLHREKENGTGCHHVDEEIAERNKTWKG